MYKSLVFGDEFVFFDDYDFTVIPLKIKFMGFLNILIKYILNK